MRLSRVSCLGTVTAVVLCIYFSRWDSGMLGFGLRILAVFGGLFLSACALGFLAYRPKVKVGAVLLFLCATILLLGNQYPAGSQGPTASVLSVLMWIILMLFQIYYPPGAAKYLPALAKTVFKLGVAIGFGLLLISHFFPKIRLNIFSELSDAHVGYGDGKELNPGELSTLLDSRLPVFHVKMQPENIDKSLLFWRGFVLDQTTDGFHWKSGPSQKVEEIPSDLPSEGMTRPLIRQDFFLEPRYAGFAFLLDYPVLRRKRSHFGEQENYSGASTLSPLKSLENIFPQERRRYLAVPQGIDSGPGGRKIRQLVEGLDHAHGEEKIVAQLMGFYAQGFQYSLTPGSYAPGELSKFLLEKKIGFCEHFAGSFAVLLRLSGVASRVVVGFHGGQLNSFDHSWLVRERDAHAWVEYWSSRRRSWARVDPSSVALPSAPEFRNPWLEQAEQALDALFMSWKWTAFREYGVALRFWGLLFLVPFLFYFGYFGAGALRNWVLLRKSNHLSILYNRYCQFMSRKIAPRKLHEGPLKYLHRCSEFLTPEKYAKCAEFTALYVSLKYGAASELKDTQHELRELRTLLNSIKRKRRHHHT